MGPPHYSAASPDRGAFRGAGGGGMSGGARRGGSVPRPVTSADNPAVREAARLERDRDAREAAGLYLAWGVHLAAEAIEAGAPIARAFVDPALAARPAGAPILARLAEAAVERLEVRPALLDRIAAGAGDQGILLLVRRPAVAPEAILAARPS